MPAETFIVRRPRAGVFAADPIGSPTFNAERAHRFSTFEKAEAIADKLNSKLETSSRLSRRAVERWWIAAPFVPCTQPPKLLRESEFLREFVSCIADNGDLRFKNLMNLRRCAIARLCKLEEDGLLGQNSATAARAARSASSAHRNAPPVPQDQSRQQLSQKG